MRCVWCWMLRCVEKDLHLRFSRFVRNVECIKHTRVYAGLAIEDWWQYEACAGISLNRIFNCGQPVVKSSLHCRPTTAIGCNEMICFTLQCNATIALHYRAMQHIAKACFCATVCTSLLLHCCFVRCKKLQRPLHPASPLPLPMWDLHCTGLQSDGNVQCSTVRTVI